MPADLLWCEWSAGSIKRNSGFTSTVSSSFAKTNPICVGWDGTDVLMVYTSPYTSIKRGTGFGATVQSSFANQSGTTTYCLAWDGTNLTTAENDTKRRRYSGFSSTISASFTGTGTQRGAGWDGTNSNFMDGTTEPKHRQYTGFSATVSSSFTTNAAPSGFCTFDQTDFLTVASGTKIRKHSGFSSTVSSSLTSFTNLEGSPGDTSTIGGAVTPTSAVRLGRGPTGGAALAGGGTTFF